MKLSGVSQEEMTEMFPHNPIIVGYRGSIAHGMYVPNSDPNSVDDKDVMGVTIAPVECYLGLSNFEQKETFLREWDVVTYEFRKFVRLLEKGNPNVLSMLWLAPQHYIYLNDAGKRLIANKELFVGKHVYKSFTGYAHGQLHRMTHHAKEGYMGAKRKKLVEKFGYDTKNAAHLIRLLRMGAEFLCHGELEVLRHDNQQLLEIKRGEWTLEQVKEEADRLFIRAEEAYDRSTLPARAQHNEIEELVIDILGEELLKGEQ